jgi:hypothetical protein
VVSLKFCFTTLLSVCAASGTELAPYLYTEAAHYDSKAAVGGERFPAGARLMLVTGASSRALVPGFAASADAAVSFDGKRVLFSGKQKPGEPWRIWEIAIEGGAPRRVTWGEEDCIRPFYLPGEQLVYARRTPRGFELEVMSAGPVIEPLVYRHRTPRGVEINEADLPGGTPLRLTYGVGNHIASDVLLDGRVLFDGPHPSGGREVYTVYSDGSGVETVRCDHGRDRHSARQLSSGDIVFESGARFRRFTSARAVEVPLALPTGEYAGPVAELAPGELLVSSRASAAEPFTLHRVRIGQAQAVPVRAAGGNALQPIVVQAHAVPKRHPSSLGDRTGANLLCLNVYTSRGAAIPEGVVAAVRVYARDDAGGSVALGQAPVEKDGSFYVQVPAERPIRFELLGRDARTVRAERGWFWARRGEQRVCVGCHAGPERAPDNAVPAVLLRTTEPVKMVLPVHSEAVNQSRGTRLQTRESAGSTWRARSVPGLVHSLSGTGGNR